MWNMFKVNNKYGPEQSHWRRSGVFIFKFERSLDHFLMFLWLPLCMYLFSGIAIVAFFVLPMGLRFPGNFSPMFFHWDNYF